MIKLLGKMVVLEDKEYRLYCGLLREQVGRRVALGPVFRMDSESWTGKNEIHISEGGTVHIQMTFYGYVTIVMLGPYESVQVMENVIGDAASVYTCLADEGDGNG